MWFSKNMKTALIFFIIFSLTRTFFSQSLTDKRSSQFIEAMIDNSDSLEKFILPEELTISKRLGITYEGVKNKFLISYELPEDLLNEINNKNAAYKINIEKLDEQYSILHFEVPAKSYKTKYYFKNEYLISPPYYYFNDWQEIESEHFIFYVSEPLFFNEYSIDMLEKFIVEMFSVMHYTKEEIQHLKENKIIYILCKNEDEIELLTGYKARGMCNLAYDYLITTYNCHYHELVHLLMNFKLKKLPLYTHPFFQEGLAVALGGRGGKETDVILSLGQFLAESGFLDYKELLNENDYKNYDASMSYPMCGLYNKFMLGIYVFNKYLELYRKYSSANIQGITISSDDLAYEQDWRNFFTEGHRNSPIKINFNETEFKTLIGKSDYSIKENDEYYIITTDESILISADDNEPNYISKTFNELYPDKTYTGEKYLIRISENEIGIYNLYTNILIANYVSGFTMDMKLVPKEDGFYKFAVQREIFDDDPNSWIIKTIKGK